jgi:hypothetical protein
VQTNTQLFIFYNFPAVNAAIRRRTKCISASIASAEIYSPKHTPEMVNRGLTGGQQAVTALQPSLRLQTMHNPGINNKLAIGCPEPELNRHVISIDRFLSAA